MYTSYFANIRNLPKDFIPVSISLYPPSWYKGVKFDLVAPDKQLLNDYKNGKCNKIEYRMRYITQLMKLDPHRILEKVVEEIFKCGYKSVDVSKICFVCYETSDEFCHRHLFANWMLGGNYNILEYINDSVCILVSGTRYATYKERTKIYRMLEYAILDLTRKDILTDLSKLTILQGEAKGVDTYARMFAEKYHIECKPFEADWDTHGKSAGFIRNSEMLEYSHKYITRVLVAIPLSPYSDKESKGTNQMIGLVKKDNTFYKKYICHLNLESDMPFR